MMATIKGPIHFKGSEYKAKIAELVSRELQKGSIKLRLPFEATNWCSAENYDKVPGGKKLVKTARKVSKRGRK